MSGIPHDADDINVTKCDSRRPVSGIFKKRCLTTEELNKVPSCCPGDDIYAPTCICVQQSPVVVSRKNIVWVQKCIREPAVVNTTKTVMVPKVVKIQRPVRIPEVTWTEGVVATPRIEYKTEECTENEIKNTEKTVWTPQEICTAYLCRPKPQRIFIPPPTDYCCYPLNALCQLPWGNQIPPYPPNNHPREDMGHTGNSQRSEPAWPGGGNTSNIGNYQRTESSWPYGENGVDIGTSQRTEPAWPWYGGSMGNIGSPQNTEPAWPSHGGSVGNIPSSGHAEPIWPSYGGGSLGNIPSSQGTESTWPWYGGNIDPAASRQSIESVWPCHRGDMVGIGSY